MNYGEDDGGSEVELETLQSSKLANRDAVLSLPGEPGGSVARGLRAFQERGSRSSV